jgi:hypothetical protein
MRRAAGAPDRTVRAVQWAIATGTSLFISAIIVWIIHLVRTAWRLGDVPSASIGISLAAIPVFLTFLGVSLYVFWGLLTGGGRRGELPADPTPRGGSDRPGGEG